MLAIHIYAINPKQTNPVEGFTLYPTEPNFMRKKHKLERDINSGDWENWPGEKRRYFVRRCKDNGWTIKIKTCMINQVSDH